MAVEVVGGEVEEDRALGGEVGCCPRAGSWSTRRRRSPRVDLADQLGERRADVAGHRDRLAGAAEDVAEQLDRGRLAVGAGDGEEAVRQRPPGQLELADHLDPALQGGRDHRRLPGHARALDDGPRPLELRQVHPYPGRLRRRAAASPSAASRMAGIDRAHRLPPRRQQPGRGLPGAGQPDDQERPVGQRRADSLAESRHFSHLRAQRHRPVPALDRRRCPQPLPPTRSAAAGTRHLPRSRGGADLG